MQFFEGCSIMENRSFQSGAALGRNSSEEGTAAICSMPGSWPTQKQGILNNYSSKERLDVLNGVDSFVTSVTISRGIFNTLVQIARVNAETCHEDLGFAMSTTRTTRAIFCLTRSKISRRALIG